MTSPDLTPERIDELVAGGTPTGSEEQAYATLLGEVRGMDAAPSPQLRERVRRIAAGAKSTPAAEAGRRFGLPRLPRLGMPRPAIVAGALALILAVAIAVPLSRDGGSEDLASGDGATTLESELGADTADDALPGALQAPPQTEPGVAAEDALPGGASGATRAVDPDALPPGPDAGRPQEVFVRTAVKVDDVEALSRAGATAMRQVRELGGFTVSSNFSVPSGDYGVNDLVLKVPADRVDQALAGFADLGTVISQQATLTDLGEPLGRVQRRIARLSNRALALREQLEAAPGDARLKAELEAVERRIAAAARQRAQLQERARLATLSLTLTTDGPAVEKEENRFIVAFTRAADRLGVVLEWLISAAVFLLPAGALAWLGYRALAGARRHQDRRVLESA
jgi:hypothetical protein